MLVNRPIAELKGVGPSISEKLARLGIRNLQDILFHLPLRYEDRTRVTSIINLKVGMPAVLEGKIIAVGVTYGRRRSLLAYLEDSTGKIGLRFFHFSKTQLNNLKKSELIRVFGEIRRGASGLEIYHPEYERLGVDKALPETLTPVYPITEGVSQGRYRGLIEQVLTILNSNPLVDLISGEIPINEALQLVHKPPVNADISALIEGNHPVQRRLAFEELLAHHTSLCFLREQINKQKAIRLASPREPCAKLVANLGFELTSAQQRVLLEISRDLSQNTPMLRLLQGDVGSGKTVVAAVAAVHAYENGLQTALMAPTEILAEQHLATFRGWLAPLGIETAWLSGKSKGAAREEELQKIKRGDAQIIIGTHALFQKDVVFQKLGLVIIDEQHRFGVNQRLALRQKGIFKNINPHQLIMTATPIPRTLTMTLYADMDVSVIDELPPGRTEVRTTVLADTRRAEVIERIQALCTEGAQAYWVCTLIEESEVLESKAAAETLKELTNTLPNLSISLIHGRMKPAEKAKIMCRFKQGEVDLLVATTVIEVGVDVPNASLMVIENSERLGLAQLHQLRGRVGRGQTASHCVLLYKSPLGELSRRRLEVMRNSNDGFFIAEEDLRIRGPGELLGSKQSGAIQFKIADLARDGDLLPRVKAKSEQLLRTEEAKIDMLIKRWTSVPEEVSQV